MLELTVFIISAAMVSPSIFLICSHSASFIFRWVIAESRLHFSCFTQRKFIGRSLVWLRMLVILTTVKLVETQRSTGNCILLLSRSLVSAKFACTSIQKQQLVFAKGSEIPKWYIHFADASLNTRTHAALPY